MSDDWKAVIPDRYSAPSDRGSKGSAVANGRQDLVQQEAASGKVHAPNCMV
jgi:hypothetical protein